MRELRCFIASAFEKNDVDTIFSKVVQPVLSKKGIISLRVDRVEHNDDIDDKILELIEYCDFSIADLTCARPSVYYEAGRVHGMGKPVIFIARSDHFKRKSDDEFGNFRIHFDLQMKNIIKWSKPTSTVKKQLESRINIVTKPLLDVLNENETMKQAQAAFSKLPQKEKFLQIVQSIKTELTKMKYQLEEKSRWYRNNFLAVKKTSQTQILVWCLAEASFTKARLKDIRNISPDNSSSLDDFLKDMKVDTQKSISLHILCCSLRSTPESRIDDALYYFWPHEHSKVYSYVTKDSSHKYFSPSRHIHFLDKLDSIFTIQDQLKKHLPLVGKLDGQKLK